METGKLYDENSHLSEFDAVVVRCEKVGENYALLLDKTAFFPESGGQPCDKGTLDGVEVLNVKEENGELIHYIGAPLEEGIKIHGKIDYFRRFSFMQNHSGEHIVSGIVHRKYGFDNVSFHLNEEFVTLDFNGILTREQLNEVEREANEAVYMNMPVTAYYPSKEELHLLEYRSKKEIDGDIRIVKIGDVDICACCAPHVDYTGEIGMIKLLDSSKMRGGTCIILKCGRYALKDYEDKFYNVAAISNMLSSKQEEAATAVENLLEKQDDIKQKVSELTKRIIDSTVKLSTVGKSLYFEKDFSIKELQIFADSLHKTHGGIKAVFSGENGEFCFAICGENEELDELFSRFKEKFSVRGGGRNGMVQGSLCADISEIKEFFGEGDL